MLNLIQHKPAVDDKIHMRYIFFVIVAVLFAFAPIAGAHAATEGERTQSATLSTLVETIPADIPREERTGRERGSLSVFGFRMQGASGYNGELPFWIHSNRFGELDPGSTTATLHLFGAWRRDYRSGISLSTGAGMLMRDTGVLSVQFQEAYLQAGYGHFVLWAGRKREYLGMVHPQLSMGTMDLSHNARPIPKITLASDGFRPFPGTRGILDYDVSISHGWMRDNEYRSVQRPLLHQKHLYIRLFNERSRVVPHAGVQHFAQWGGESPLTGAVPVGPRAFRDVFFSRSSNAKELFEGGLLGNQYQNHVGTYDFSLLFRFDRYRVSVSRQFILEDTPNARFGTPWDGMWGAWIEFHPDRRSGREEARPGRRNDRNSSQRPDHHPSHRPDHNSSHRPDRNSSQRTSDSDNARSSQQISGRSAASRPFFVLRAINYEHMNTIAGVDRYPHRDRSNYFNYYNHSAYRGGWTYNGRSLGNPLFLSDNYHIGVVNNLILAHHVGVMGYAGPADWRLFTTYSRNYGASGITGRDGRGYSGVTGRRDQWSFMLELGGPDLLAGLVDLLAPGMTVVLHELELTATFGLDIGQAQRKNAGVMVGLRWATR